jgi:hypothetical protein
MTCTRRFLTFSWQHHAWRRRVSATSRPLTPVTDMWGRRISQESVRCHTEYVCDVCGKVRDGVDCLCDAAKGDRCGVRRAFIDSSPQPATEAVPQQE